MKQYLLISNTKDYKINNNIVEYLSTILKDVTFEEKKFRMLSSHKAYELELQNKNINLELKKFIINLLSQNQIDCNFITATKDRRKKLLLADMDSTIIKEESLDELAKQIGKEKEVVKITNEAMNGRIDFKKALLKRVAIFKGQPAEILERLKEGINVNDGAVELIKTMKHNNSLTVLVSGGFTFLTEYLKKMLGFDYTHANSLEISKNNSNDIFLTGKVTDPILDKQAKAWYLDQYVIKNKLSYEDTVCVGDGANDIEMIKKAGFGVSYNGKRALDEQANIHFKNTSLLGLLYAQGYSDKQILS
jgi:phosphoserine phosphatase